MRISIANLLNPSRQKSLVGKGVVLLDHLLGVAELNRLYHQHGFSGLDADAFTARFLQVFDINLQLDGSLEQIPEEGPLIICANHPFGGIEGVALAHLLRRRRADVKILANRVLSLFVELEALFIYTNPLRSNAAGNTTSLKSCLTHLRQGGLLVLFPAGRVSYPPKHGVPIRDHQWNRMVASLARQATCKVMPLHISGQNRPLFYQLGLIWSRLRMLMLIREMLHSHGKSITISTGKPAVLPVLKKDRQHITDLYRLVTYLHDPQYRHSWPLQPQKHMVPVADAAEPKNVLAEVAQLSGEHCLLRYKNFAVYYATRKQVPQVIEEIQRLREENFRPFDEGSGACRDGDPFDDTYTHLFVFDHSEKSIVGAYRMGQTDRILPEQGKDGLYLSHMFTFKDDFVNQRQPCLEMGRSFVVVGQQRSYNSLLLLFKGIGAFVCRFPRYRLLYGTVSLSRRYQALSVLLIEQFLVAPSAQVKAKMPFDYPAPPELLEYLTRYPPDIDSLDWLVRQIEPDEKGLPVLVRQYHQLGARFYGIGIDPNFAGTPGLLLSVDLPAAPQKLLRRYMGRQLDDYLSYQQP